MSTPFEIPERTVIEPYPEGVHAPSALIALGRALQEEILVAQGTPDVEVPDYDPFVSDIRNQFAAVFAARGMDQSVPILSSTSVFHNIATRRRHEPLEEAVGALWEQLIELDVIARERVYVEQIHITPSLKPGDARNPVDRMWITSGIAEVLTSASQLGGAISTTQIDTVIWNLHADKIYAAYKQRLAICARVLDLQSIAISRGFSPAMAQAMADE